MKEAQPLLKLIICVFVESVNEKWDDLTNSIEKTKKMRNNPKRKEEYAVFHDFVQAAVGRKAEREKLKEC